MTMRVEKHEVKQMAAGHWREIHVNVCGIDPRILDGKGHPCPVCKDGSDRFSVFKDYDQTGGAICWKCQPERNGDGLWLIQKTLGVGFPEALQLVAGHLGIVPSENGKSAMDIIEKLAACNDVPIDAFKSYGAESATRKGTCSDQVARFPVYNEMGERHSYFDIWLKGNDRERKGKLKQGKGSSGLFFPDGRIPKPGECWLITEGPKDAAFLYSLGYLACGISGSQLAAKYAPLFRGCSVTLVPDNDTAGHDGQTNRPRDCTVLPRRSASYDSPARSSTRTAMMLAVFIVDTARELSAKQS